MAFQFIETEIKDLIVIEPHLFEDNRGIYRKYYEKAEFFAHNIRDEFWESSDLYSKKGALRGLHYQTGESQSKLIRVVSGKLFDVVVDLRKDSETFGKCHTELLSGEDNRTVYIPRGFAHGFIALEDNTIFSYQCGGQYVPEKCGGIIWNDSNLNIYWPLEEYGIQEIFATQKDKNWPDFLSLRDKFLS